MDRFIISSVFQELLLLPRGEKRILLFDTPQAIDCARVQFYQEKRKYQKEFPLEKEEIILSKKKKGDKYLLTLEKVNSSFTLYKEDKDGNLIPCSTITLQTKEEKDIPVIKEPEELFFPEE